MWSLFLPSITERVSLTRVLHLSFVLFAPFLGAGLVWMLAQTKLACMNTSVTTWLTEGPLANLKHISSPSRAVTNIDPNWRGCWTAPFPSFPFFPFPSPLLLSHVCCWLPHAFPPPALTDAAAWALYFSLRRRLALRDIPSPGAASLSIHTIRMKNLSSFLRQHTSPVLV